MSCNYAEGLSPYENKGRLGAPEKFDNALIVEEKVELLAEWVRNAKHIVVHTGAGISTSAGIPDFRGPKGVWTLEKKGLKPDVNVSWDDAKPTVTHMALARLVEMDRVKYIITQNIDGLHLRSGVPRTKISELHGNMFADQCDKCKKMVVRDSPAPTVGQKYSGEDCPAYRHDGRKCRGKMRDFVLDWEDSLPDDDLTISDTHAMMADLSIVMGSTLQIIPAGNMPTYTKKYHTSGKLVICNLQPTKHAKRADLNIHTYVDDIMTMLMDKLDLKIPEYNPETDPVKLTRLNQLPEQGFIDWTQCPTLAKTLKKLGDKIHDDFLKMKREEKKRKSLDYARQNKMRKREENESLEDPIQEDGEEDDDKKSSKAEVKEENAGMDVTALENKLHLNALPQNTSAKVEVTDQVQNLKREDNENSCEAVANAVNTDDGVEVRQDVLGDVDKSVGEVKKDVLDKVKIEESELKEDKLKEETEHEAMVNEDNKAAAQDNLNGISNSDESHDKPDANTVEANGLTPKTGGADKLTDISAKANYTLSTSEKALTSPLAGL